MQVRRRAVEEKNVGQEYFQDDLGRTWCGDVHVLSAEEEGEKNKDEGRNSETELEAGREPARSQPGGRAYAHRVYTLHGV